MAETEKVTVNLSVVDLGKIDFLVDQGFYSNRTDFMRTAVRNQVGAHQSAMEAAITRRAFVIGVLIYTAQDLNRYRDAGERLDIRVVGMLVFDESVTPDLAQAVVRSIHIFGVVRAPAAVKEVLSSCYE